MIGGDGKPKGFATLRDAMRESWWRHSVSGGPARLPTAAAMARPGCARMAANPAEPARAK